LHVDRAGLDPAADQRLTDGLDVVDDDLQPFL